MTIVNIKLQDDAHIIDKDGRAQPVYAQYQDIDLDKLTPKARALAEAVADRPLRTVGDIWMEADRPLRDTTPNWAAWYSEEEAARPDRRPWRGWARYPAASPMDPYRYLENEAAKIPPGWHVLGAHPDKPVPSRDAAAADTHMTRDKVMAHMESKGAALSPAGWETLRQAGHLPQPDRYVQGKPQWRQETIDAYLGRDRELWPISRVAEYLGYEGPSATGSARSQLSRWGIVASGRRIDANGRAHSLFAADQIQAAHANRPGRGARTDRAATA